MKKLICILLILFTPYLSSADVTFTDGLFETTFDCVEQDQSDTGWVTCDGLTSGGSGRFMTQILVDGIGTNNWTESLGGTNEWYFSGSPALVGDQYAKELFVNGIRQTDGDILYTGTIGALTNGLAKWGNNALDSVSDTWYVYHVGDPDLSSDNGYIYTFLRQGTYESGDYISSITSSANNTLDGTDSRAFRKMTGSGVTMDAGPLAGNFTTPQKHVWIRWYERPQEGYNWWPLSQGPYPYSQKSVYLFTATTGTSPIVEYYYKEYRIAAQNSPVSTPVITTGDNGWPEVMGVDPETGGGATGDYVCWEVEIKMDTDNTDGIGRIWREGVLIAENTSVDWSGANNTAQEILDAQEGFTSVSFGVNQGIADTVVSALIPTAMYWDYDNISIANTDETLQDDGNGNKFIGPIPPTTAVAKRAVLKRAIIK